MTVINRQQLKSDWSFFRDHIQKIHVMGPEIYDELFVNSKPVKGLCHKRRYFMIMGEYHLSYDMEHIITDPNLNLIGRSLRQVILYDSFQEYEGNRVREMSTSKGQTGLHYN